MSTKTEQKCSICGYSEKDHYMGGADHDFSPANDQVNHPSHYTFGKYEVFDVLMDWFNDLPLLWQVVKYLARAKHKGNYLQDLKKAQWYLNEAIKQEEARLAEIAH